MMEKYFNHKKHKYIPIITGKSLQNIFNANSTGDIWDVGSWIYYSKLEMTAKNPGQI